MLNLPAPLAPLAAYRQFVTYRLVPSARPGKTDKLPLDWRTGRMAPKDSGGHMSAEYRCSFEEAAAAVAAGRGDGVGFVFTDADPFWFVDIDGAWDGSAWSALATSLCSQLAGAAVEVSQSGRGLHIIGTGALPEHGCKNIPLGLELYHTARFVALTGQGATGDALHDASAQLTALVPQYFPPNAPAVAGAPDEWTEAPVPEWSGPSDDDDLIRLAMASGGRSAAAAFGGDAVTFADLWEAREAPLSKRWPGDSGAYDASSADAALAAHLAFWTGKDCERIRALMYRSALAREKWDMRADYYLPRTIIRACGVSTEVCKNRAESLPPPPPAPEVFIDAGIVPRANQTGYSHYNDQLIAFKGCVYIRSENKVLVPDGGLLDQARFNVQFGGAEFTITAVGDKPTRSAWTAFTENTLFHPPIAEATCFRPECAPGALLQEEGRLLVNTWQPIETLRLAGDAGPFEDFMRRLLPDERDRRILLSYFAAVLRYPGRKFQWWPVLQGTKGNGKSLLLRIMSHAVGHRYTHLANVAKMARGGANFNGWVQGNLFVGLEEIYVANRRDFLEEFKPYVTNDRLPYEKKGVDETVGDNRCNGLALTNHQDGLPIDDDERRYAIFFTAQQRAADLERDGMGGMYFPDLYDWLYGRGAYAHLGPNYGYAVCNGFLRDYAIDEEFNPAGMSSRAPETSSTAQAVSVSKGRAEQEVEEAIAQGRPGFAGGWVSSKALDDLLDKIRAPVPRNKRCEMLEKMGYVRHPSLHDGRVNAIVQPDNAKPRLFIKSGHILGNLATGAEVAKRYQADQQTATVSDAEKAFK